jgi:hypothetical protein
MQDIAMPLPLIDHYGNSIPEKAVFFKKPNRIGKIISGSTSFFETSKPLTSGEKTGKYAKFIIISLVIGGLICLIFRVTSPIWLSIWIAIPFIIALIAASNSVIFKGVCNYIGENGFAEYSFLNTPENITSATEISFDDVTHIIKGSVVKKRNFNYEGTDYFFLWLHKGKQIHIHEGTHQNKNNEARKYPFPYHFMTLAEDQWTKLLVQNMYDDLRQNGFIVFDIIVKPKDSENYVDVPYIKLGEGFVEFLFKDNPIKYDRKDIKKIYFQNGNLFIEHNNYEKKFFGWVEKGNKNGIPLTNLGNQKFFFMAFPLLMGFDL